MRKSYLVSLDKKTVEFVKPILEKKGISFSGYLNESLVTFKETHEAARLPDDVTKITLLEAVQSIQRVIKSMNTDLKKENIKPAKRKSAKSKK